ncbi:hypothetical protein F0344_34870 (plasmid) [Streptomyces finlayi]|uniref:Uncharacterized protein n=1 Tax=Streptomyces finlayi TaxID=67296 RepID=A0A7G7BWC5_9ACTN|nr:hypothetical protein [Streptomyces finlayi]QNE79640.1 hypothetical protein F0344_34870 [Streptomyces finlayi]
MPASVIRAATVDGVAGTFTAGRLTCVSHPGHESCAWTGTFRSTDGTVLRQGVAMYGSGRGSLETYRRTAVVDVGNTGRVYSPEGSQEWIFTVLPAGAGAAIFVVLARRHLMPLPLRKNDPQEYASPREPAGPGRPDARGGGQFNGIIRLPVVPGRPSASPARVRPWLRPAVGPRPSAAGGREQGAGR